MDSQHTLLGGMGIAGVNLKMALDGDCQATICVRYTLHDCWGHFADAGFAGLNKRLIVGHGMVGKLIILQNYTLKGEISASIFKAWYNSKKMEYELSLYMMQACYVCSDAKKANLKWPSSQFHYLHGIKWVIISQIWWRNDDLVPFYDRREKPKPVSCNGIIVTWYIIHQEELLLDMYLYHISTRMIKSF